MYYTAQELVDMLNRDEGEAFTVRKVRYYAQIELLSSPELVNGKKKYTDKHLEELRAIRKLQKTGSTLDDIKTEIRGLGQKELSKVSQNAMYFSQKSILDKNVVSINTDIALLFGNDVEDSLQEEIVRNVRQIINNHKGEL